MFWSEKEIQLLSENYAIHSIGELEHLLGRSKNSIYSKASQLKLSRLEYNREFMREKSRKYNLNHSYFETIDTEDKAYFLGILFADGYNYEKRNHISISLQEKDKELLLKLNECIDSERPLFYKVDDREGRRSNSYILSFSSKIMSERLAELGCGQRKTDSLQFPTYIREDLYRHFIRGYFDGDGSVIITTGNNGKYDTAVIKSSITGNKDFCHGLYNYLINKISNKGMSVIQDRRHKNVYMLTISGHYRALTFLSYIYSNSSIFMDRKKNAYKAIDIGLNDDTLRGKDLIMFIQQQQQQQQQQQ